MPSVFTGLRGPIRLSTDTFGTLWAYDSRGPAHPALPVSAPARTGEDLTAAERRMTAELSDKGLLDGQAVHPDLRGACELIEHAEREFYGWLAFGPTHQISALVAARSDVAIRAVLDAGTVYLEPAPPARPAAALVALLPPSAGRGQRLSARLSEVHTTRPEFFVDGEPGNQDGPESWLRALLRAARSGAGTCNAAARKDGGTRERGERPLSYVDVDATRWVLQASAWGGDEWLSATPATSEDFAAALARAVQAL